MIRNFFILISFCTVMLSCKKSSPDNGCTLTASTVVVPTSEMTTLQTYITANRPTAILHSGGFYYEIVTAGTGTVKPGICSGVSVRYSGYLTNGTKFTSPAEETTGATYTLGKLIPGWQRGLPLVTTGARINLFLPPSLAYGSSATATIPANSILIFSIDLLGVQ